MKQQKVCGFYHAHGYNLWLMEDGDVVRELYSAGNSPYDSSTMVPVERGESIGTLAEWCEQTGSELAESMGLEWVGCVQEDDPYEEVG